MVSYQSQKAVHYSNGKFNFNWQLLKTTTPLPPQASPPMGPPSPLFPHPYPPPFLHPPQPPAPAKLGQHFLTCSGQPGAWNCWTSTHLCTSSASSQVVANMLYGIPGLTQEAIWVALGIFLLEVNWIFIALKISADSRTYFFFMFRDVPW